jgi:hypothetical protein
MPYHRAMKTWFLCLLALTSTVFGKSFCFKDRLETAHPGDYIVTEANKMITVLSIRSITPSTLILEEITAPLQNLKKRPPSWPEWVKAKAPGHTSWSMVEIDLETDEILECYSFSKLSWIHLTEKESLLATLLHLPLQKIPEDKRRKIGPAPLQGEPDFRKCWNPPLTLEGKKWEKAQFEVYQTVWPKDDSELSGQEVSLYFDREKRSPFPFWIQIQTSHATAALRAIDSGKKLPIVYKTLPRRVPEFIGTALKNQEKLTLNLKAPKYYKKFELYAIDVTTREKQILPITHSLLSGEGERKTIEIPLEELKENLQLDHKYTWLLIPSGHSGSYTETSKPFVWTGF